MAVPPFQDFLLPTLEFLADGRDRAYAEVIDHIARRLQLSDEDKHELLPSGRRTRLEDRVRWAVTYLKRSLLVANTSRRAFRITERGRQVLSGRPARIDINYLMRFREFQEFRGQIRNEQPDAPEHEIERTPQEILEDSYQNLRRELARELLQRVKTAPPAFFEQLVVDLLVAMGYGGSRRDAGRAIGQTGDGGIDGIIKEDRLGLDVVYIQAKRWDGTVGRPTVQAFAGGLDGQRARKGVLITTSQFCQDAKEYVSRIEKKIVLIEGEQLAQYMIDFGIGVTEVASYAVKKVDADYFGEE